MSNLHLTMQVTPKFPLLNLLSHLVLLGLKSVYFVFLVGFFLGKGSSLTPYHLLFLPECRPDTFPCTDWGATSLSVAILKSLQPNSAAVGLSLLRPCARWQPKYSSTSSWQKRYVRTNSKPLLNKNLVTAMAEVTVIFSPLNVCLLINIRPLSSFEKSPSLASVDDFQLFKYSRKTFCSQSNRSSSARRYGASKAQRFF